LGRSRVIVPGMVAAAYAAPPAASGIHIGWNFRKTAGHRTDDGSIDVFAYSDVALKYPYEFTNGVGTTINAGWQWEQGGDYGRGIPYPSLSIDDTTASDDPRLAGYMDNDSQVFGFCNWRIAVPAGNYRVWAGGGHTAGVTSVFEIRIYDGIDDTLQAENVGKRLLYHSNNTAGFDGSDEYRDISASAKLSSVAWVAGYDSAGQDVVITDDAADTGMLIKLTPVAASGYRLVFNHIRILQL